MSLQIFPAFTDISLTIQPALEEAFSKVDSGISEYSFTDVFCFQEKYSYQASLLEPGKVILKGQEGTSTFFSLPNGFPNDLDFTRRILESCDTIKGVSEAQVKAMGDWLVANGYEISEDRDNYDYIYSRQEMSSLTGNQHRTRRHQLNTFKRLYPHRDVRPLATDNYRDARLVLEEWRALHNGAGDYEANKKALDFHGELGLDGIIVYVDEKPIAFSMGKPNTSGEVYTLYFEKSLSHYAGSYQFLNWSSGNALPESCKFINMQQDLGDPGLRQAKMTYRPIHLIKKLRIFRASSTDDQQHSGNAQECREPANQPRPIAFQRSQDDGHDRRR